MKAYAQLIASAASRALLAGIVTLALLPQAGNAQDISSEAGAAEATADIVVTARRREENLQSVPVAVTALSAETLAAKGIRDSADISAVTPGLYLGGGSFSSTNTNIALRGITSPGANITFDPSIGIYVDEVYLARNYGSLFDYFDVSNVQVLRGVQGTLFGRNNTGGAVLLSTTKPKNEAGGNVEVSYGNYNAFKLGAVVNLPVVKDLLAVRVGGQVYTRSGYGRDVNLGTPLADARNRVVRASALLTPSSAVEAQVTYEYSDHKDSGPIFTPILPLPRTIRPGLGFYEVSYDTPVYEQGFDERIDGHLRADLGPIRAKLIAAHLYGTTVTNQDVDATSSGPAANLNLLRNTTHTQDSAEFQISGDALNERIAFVTGLYWLKEDAYQPTLNVVTNVRQRLFVNNEAKAAYGHVDVKLTDAFEIGAGVRYTQDDKGTRYGSFNETTRACVPLSSSIQTAAGAAYSATDCMVTLQNTTRYWSYDFSANYQVTPDILLYARTGKGQKSGGFNSAISSVGDLTAYRPEIAQDYELGFKSQWFDRRVRFNVAVYQTDYKDIQRAANVSITLPTTPPTTTTAIVVSNAAKARIRGVEAEVSARLGSGFEIGANYAHVDPKYLSFTSLSTAGAVIDQRNFPFQYVSKHQFGANIGYDSEVAGLGRVRANVDYAYRSRYANYTAPDPATDQRGFSLVNARASIVPEGLPNVEFGAWVKNLFDQQYWTGSSLSSAVHFAVPGRPRMFGADVKIRFGQ